MMTLVRMAEKRDSRPAVATDGARQVSGRGKLFAHGLSGLDAKSGASAGC